jgi:hypothetical protein
VAGSREAATAPAIEIRRLAPGDLDAVAVMCREVFGTSHDAAHYRWKYFGNPAGDPLAVVAYAGARPVGIMGAIPVRVRVAGVEQLFVQELDVGVLEAHRGLKLFLGMAAKTGALYRTSGATFCYGMGNEFSAGVGTRMFGRRLISAAPRLARVLDYRPFLRRRAAAFAALAGAAGALANVALSPRPPRPPRGLAIRDVRGFDRRFDALWQSVRDDYPVAIERTAAYLAWRYGDPGTAYRTVSVEDQAGERVLGYAVTSIREAQGARRGTIVDLLSARGGAPAVAAALIAAAVAVLAEGRAEVADCWMFPHAHFTPPLRRLGFVPRRAGVMDLTVGPAGAVGGIEDGVLATPASWYFTAGDTDWV